MSVYDKNGAMIADLYGKYRALETGRLALKRPYWVFHLDCGRKFFSVSNIKSMIDAMYTNGLNQLQLHFSDDRGFRFALNDMTAIDSDGNSYDLSQCVTTDSGGYLTESDMDEIIVYARSKNIEVVPDIDMPGHMNTILTAFPAFRYNPNYAWTLDATNETAVKFALAIVEKYANYFQARGCQYWNIGADEVGYAGTGMGRWHYLNDDDIPAFVEFVNTIARYVSSIGMIPRAFNDGVLFDGDYANLFDKNIEIYYWANPGVMAETGRMQTASTLITNGYRLINTSAGYYFVVPNSNDKTSNPAMEKADILRNFYDGTKATYDQDGACFAVWCDFDTTYDGGNAALPSILAGINSFGTGIGLTTPNITYPIIGDT